jgi:transcription elongation factor SPT5
VERYDTDDIVKLKIVPRIDYSVMTPADKKKKKNIRPFAKLFSVDSVQDKKSLSNLRGGYYQYQGDLFDRNGYLEKDVRVSNLILDNVNPSLEELTRFSGGAITENSMELAQLAQPTSHVAENFEVGEKVEVIEGDLMNLPGTVQSVERDIITIKASGEFGLDRTLQFSASQLRKLFSEGDHVKVVNGIHKNETGMILNIANHVVTLLTDGSMKSIQVFSKDLRSAADVTTIEVSNTPGNQYEINDLVHLSPTEVAVVLKIDREFIHIMNQHGTILKVKPQQISSKRDSRRAVTTDSQGISMTAGDTVQVYDPRKADLNRRATILHVFRGFVFVQSRDVSENNGVFVTKASNLTVMGTSTVSFYDRIHIIRMALLEPDFKTEDLLQCLEVDSKEVLEEEEIPY